MPITKPLLVVAAASIAAGLSACGTTSSGRVSAGSVSATTPITAGPALPTTTLPATTTTTAPPTTTTTAPPVPAGWKSVTFDTVQFAVPSDWPVYDLRTNPNTCVRFDVHAVYLGHVGAHPQCPATVLGKTDAVHVEALDSTSRAQVVLGPTPTTIDGQPAQTDPNSATTRSIVVALESSQVLVTLSYESSPATDQQILATFHPTNG
jgi:hypothetical protein